MPNRGVSPIDVTSPVGQVRLNVGDTRSVPLSPVETGFVDYERFSDEELANFLLGAAMSVKRATGYAYLQMAAGAALTSSSIKTNDLAVDDTKRAAELRLVAAGWFAEAVVDESRALDDLFDVVPFTVRTPSYLV